MYMYMYMYLDMDMFTYTRFYVYVFVSIHIYVYVYIYINLSSDYVLFGVFVLMDMLQLACMSTRHLNVADTHHDTSKK